MMVIVVIEVMMVTLVMMIIVVMMVLEVTRAHNVRARFTRAGLGKERVRAYV